MRPWPHNRSSILNHYIALWHLEYCLIYFSDSFPLLPRYEERTQAHKNIHSLVTSAAINPLSLPFDNKFTGEKKKQQKKNSKILVNPWWPFLHSLFTSSVSQFDLCLHHPTEHHRDVHEHQIANQLTYSQPTFYLTFLCPATI